MASSSRYTAFSSGKIKVGAKFSSFTEVKAAIFNLEKNSSSKYYLQEAHRISALQSNVRDHIEKKLLYYEVIYACIRGRKKYQKEREDNVEKKKYSGKGCPALVRLRISHNGKYLQVKSCILEHNHELLKFQINMWKKTKKVARKKRQKSRDSSEKGDTTIFGNLEAIQDDLHNIQTACTNSVRKECTVKSVGNTLATSEVTLVNNQLEKNTAEQIKKDSEKAKSETLNKDKKDVKSAVKVQSESRIKRMCEVITMKRYMSNQIAKIKTEKTIDDSECEKDQIVILRNSLEKMRKEYKCAVGEKNRQVTMAEDLISDLTAEINTSETNEGPSTSEIGDDEENSSSKKENHVNNLVINALKENIQRYKREAKEKNKQLALTESQLKMLNSLIEESSAIRDAQEAIQSDLAEISNKKFSLESDKPKRSREHDDDDDSSEERTKKQKTEGNNSNCSSGLSEICDSSESDSDVESDSASSDTSTHGAPQANADLNSAQEGAKKYKCDGCNKRFNHSKSLAKHKLRHPHIKAEYKHQCYLCTFATNTHSDFQAHLSVHSEEQHSKKIYICSICQKSFKHVTELHKHKRANHYKSKPFNCKVCGKAFAKNNDRLKHEKFHTGYRPHKCQYCCRGFQEVSYLKEHVIQFHTHKYPYNCHLCDKGFMKPHQWRTHVAKIHPED